MTVDTRSFESVEDKIIGAERTAREKTYQGMYRTEFESTVQNPIDERNPVLDRLKYVVNNGKEPEDPRLWFIIIMLGVLFFINLMGTR